MNPQDILKSAGFGVIKKARIELRKHADVEIVENPETGQKEFPWTTSDGYAVLAGGSVEECDCDRCLARELGR